MKSKTYGELKSKIAAVLRRYFEVDDSGNANPEFDDSFSAQDAIDEIHSIVGSIDPLEKVAVHVTGIVLGVEKTIESVDEAPAEMDIVITVPPNIEQEKLGDIVLKDLENRFKRVVMCCAWDVVE